jgi:nitrogen regulatory protein PII
MKLIVVLVKPHHLEALKDAILGHGADGLTVSEVRVPASGRTEHLRGAPFSIDWVAVMRVEIAVKEQAAADVIRAVAHFAEGTPTAVITCQPLDAIVRIRTDERGVLAL